MKVLRTRPWLAILSALTTLAFLGGAWAHHVAFPANWLVSSALALCGAIGLLGFAEALLTRIVLERDVLVFRTLRNTRRFDRDQIVQVRWEKGCGISIRLTDQTWVEVPNLGYSNPALANEIRRWLRRADSEN
jgi:hypothetical protein